MCPEMPTGHLSTETRDPTSCPGGSGVREKELVLELKLRLTSTETMLVSGRGDPPSTSPGREEGQLGGLEGGA